MAALAAVRAAKTAITANVSMETKHLPSIAPKTVISVTNDDKTFKTSKDMYVLLFKITLLKISYSFAIIKFQFNSPML